MQILYACCTALAITTTSSALTVYLASTPNQFNASVSSTSLQTPELNETDAVTACRIEAKKQFGKRLVRTHVNTHSTRLQNDRDIYVVVLEGAIGDPISFDEAIIYCYVDQHNYAVKYFRSFNSRGQPLLIGSGQEAFQYLFK